MENTKKKQASAVAREASIGVRTAAGHIFSCLCVSPVTCADMGRAYRMSERMFHRAIEHMGTWSDFEIEVTRPTASSHAFSYALGTYATIEGSSWMPADPSARAAIALAQESSL